MAVHAGVISGGVLQRFAAFGLVAAVGRRVHAKRLHRAPGTWTEVFDHPDFRFERPTVRPEIDQTSASYFPTAPRP